MSNRNRTHKGETTKQPLRTIYNKNYVNQPIGEELDSNLPVSPALLLRVTNSRTAGEAVQLITEILK